MGQDTHGCSFLVTCKLLTSNVHSKFGKPPNELAFAALARPLETLGASPFTLLEKLGGGVARILLPYLHFHGSCTTIAHPKYSSQELVKMS